MGSTFNPQILADKLSKVNSSQQSIETLSHWCIFHMNKARQVVETWDRQFHSAPREQRLAFLYLANDILQNSRRKGAEYVAEFWKVLPDALRDVIANGDESGRNAALRLINIWEERKVFGSRGLVLKEEIVKRPLDNGNRNLMNPGFRMRSPGGNALDKLVSGYQAVYGSQVDEDVIFNKCKNANSVVEKVDKDIEEGHASDSITDELKGQDAVLRDCIEQLRVIESSRTNLVSLLREALQEQEYKLDQVRDQLQAAQTHSEQAGSICRLLPGNNGNDQSTSVTYTRQMSSHIEEETKSAAAAMAEKLASSTSSAQMLTYVLSSLASGGVIGNNNPVNTDSSTEYPSEKRAKIENDSQDLTNPDERPPPPSSPPPQPPLPPPVEPYVVPQYMQNVMPMMTGPYGYNMTLQPPQATVPGYVPVGPPGTAVSTFAPTSSGYQSYPTEGGFYGQPSSLPMGPMGHQ